MKKWDIDISDGDSVWCAFDVDDNGTQVINSAYEYAKKRNIKVALSNPSFELWFLLHFKDVFSQISRQDTITELKSFIPNYEKNKSVNSFLFSKLKSAIKRAKNLNKHHINNKCKLYSFESNPSTQVFQLIEFIQNTMKNRNLYSAKLKPN